MSHQSPPESLSPSDAGELDALVEGSSLRNAPDRPPLDQRGQRIADLLQLLELSENPETDEFDPQRRELLINVTMARVLRSARTDAAGVIQPDGYPCSLSEESAESLDAHVEAGWAGSGKLGGLLSLLDNSDQHMPGASAQIESTLARVQDDIDSRASRFRLEPIGTGEFAGVRHGFRLSDLVAVAAMLLIGTAILWPVLVAQRSNVYLAGCASNMQYAGLGFSQYAKDNDSRLPKVEDQADDGPWWHVGDHTRSHSANLFLLPRHGYMQLNNLACPGNPFAPAHLHAPDARDWESQQDVSYSLQVYAGDAPRLTGSSEDVILTDRSPVIMQAFHRQSISPHANSRNHGGRGQHVLFGDMSASFTVRPFVDSGDNLWLPKELEHAQMRSMDGTERPMHASDAFVGP